MQAGAVKADVQVLRTHSPSVFHPAASACLRRGPQCNVDAGEWSVARTTRAIGIDLGAVVWDGERGVKVMK